MAKKKNRKKIRNPKPDQVEYFGPFGMARYGKFMVMRNFMNADQHEKYLQKAAENYPEVCKDIDSRVEIIRSLVSEFHPLHLLKYGYDFFVAKSIGKIAEAELDSSVAIALRMVDYIQSIIVSTQKSETTISDQINEDKWKELHNEVEQLYYQLNSTYQISRTAYLKLNSDNYDAEYDAIYVKAQMLWANVRGHRYSVHDIPHLRRLISPHDDIFRELFGISSHEFLDGIQKMQESLLFGLPDAYLELKEFQKKTMDLVEERISEVPTDEGLKELTHKIVKAQGWQEWQNSIMGRIFLFDLFDVTKVTGLPDSILNELSWEPGEYLDFFSPGEFAGWPLRLLPVQIRPFIRFEGKCYCFDIFSLMDNLYRIVQRMITRLKPEYKESWNNKQNVISENLPFELFQKLLPGANFHQQINHLWSTGKAGEQNWCETDGIVLYDDHLIVVEIKAGAFTFTPPASDFSAYIDSIKNLLLKPAMQAKRFLDYLNSAEEVPIYDKNKTLVTTLRRSCFRHITSCCVTIDNFTTLASQAENLKSIGTDLQGFPVWSISVDDLQVYADIFESPLMFTHFLEERKRAFESPALRVNDELEHLALYLKHNRYVSYAADFYEDHPISWHAYLTDLDKYFHELQVSPQSAMKPTQPLPRRVSEILRILEIKKKVGRCKASGYLLDMAGETRKAFDTSIEEVLSRQIRKRKFIPFSTFGGTNLTVFCHVEGLQCPDISWMYDYILATLLRTNEEERMMIFLSFNTSNYIVDVLCKFFTPLDIPVERYDELKRFSEEQRSNYLQSYMNEKQVKKIGRNEICPCGRGFKYKKCCGR